jgi:7-carboxy-7-deazaguanine synthase
MQDNMYWRNLGVIGNNDEVKFVISNREDYDYSKKIIADYQLFDRTKNIFFSPTWNEDMELAKELSSWMLEDKSLAKLMIQQHKVLYGKDKRSV